MKTEKYFFNDENEELIILTEEDGESSVQRLDLVCSYEYDDEEQEDEEVRDDPPKRMDRPKKEKVAGGGVADDSWRHKRRVTRKQREQVKELLSKGFNSQRISDEIDEDLEFTNEIIDRVRGEDMESKVEDDKEGISL